MSRHLSFTIAVMLVLGLAGSAAAQPPHNPPSAASSSKFLAIPGLFPLSMTSVQRDIGLTADQKQELKSVSDGYRGSMDRIGRAFNKLEADEKKEQAKDYSEQAALAAHDSQQKAEAILSPQQLRIVRAVAFQLSATGALADPNVQEKIGLSDEQRERLNKVFEAAGEKMQQLQRETAQQATQVLESEQLAELKKQINAQQKPQ